MRSRDDKGSSFGRSALSGKGLSLKKKESKTREKFFKSKSRKDVNPGERLTYEQIKNFDENERARRKLKE